MVKQKGLIRAQKWILKTNSAIGVKQLAEDVCEKECALANSGVRENPWKVHIMNMNISSRLKCLIRL